jgi:hypothetical protein
MPAAAAAEQHKHHGYRGGRNTSDLAAGLQKRIGDVIQSRSEAAIGHMHPPNGAAGKLVKMAPDVPAATSCCSLHDAMCHWLTALFMLRCAAGLWQMTSNQAGLVHHTPCILRLLALALLTGLPATLQQPSNAQRQR